MVIGSRYHSLVAALSCGVPCIAIGWSHKYAELMAECDSDDCLFSLDGNTNAFLAKAKQFSDVSQNQTTRLKLRKIAVTKAQSVQDMWDEVAQALTWGNRRHG